MAVIRSAPHAVSPQETSKSFYEEASKILSHTITAGMAPQQFEDLFEYYASYGTSTDPTCSLKPLAQKHHQGIIERLKLDSET